MILSLFILDMSVFVNSMNESSTLSYVHYSKGQRRDRSKKCEVTEVLVRGVGNMRGLKVRDETINGCRGVAGVSSHFA